MKKELSIIILNWNGKSVTTACLASLRSQLRRNYEVIVVDNASTDGSAEYLKHHYPFIKLIQNKKNLGYAGGNNVGIRKAQGQYVLILNNDTTLDQDFLKELMKQKNKADILGVKMFYDTNKTTLWATGSVFNEHTMKGTLRGNKQQESIILDKEDTDYVVGCAMLVNKNVFKKVGLLNEDYFCYYEETEWQIRARKQGFTISWIPEAKLWHKVGYSTGGGRTPLSAYYLVRNRAYLIQTQGKHKLIAYTHWTIEVLGRIVYGLLKGNFMYTRMSIKGCLDFLRKKQGMLIP